MNVFPLHILPLRERKGDIVPLAKLAIRKHTPAGRVQPHLTVESERQLLAHSWPGNVRELENVIQRALILSQGDSLDAGSLVLDGASLPGAAVPDSAAALQDDLKRREHELIVEALREADGNRKAVSKKLGISPRTLRYKLARMRADGFAPDFME